MDNNDFEERLRRTVIEKISSISDFPVPNGELFIATCLLLICEKMDKIESHLEDMGDEIRNLKD